MRRASELPWVTTIGQVGIRGIGGSGRAELEDAIRWGAHIVSASTIRDAGIQAALDKIEANENCLITIDCDGLDPSVIPGVIIPQPGGLSYANVIQLIAGVSHNANIVGFDLVELVPERDVQGLGALAAARIVCNVIGCVGNQRVRSASPRQADPGRLKL